METSPTETARESNILFINKSAKSKSLSRSSGLERARIFSHVQQIPSTASPTSRELGGGRETETSTGVVVWQLPIVGEKRESSASSRSASAHSSVTQKVQRKSEKAESKAHAAIYRTSRQDEEIGDHHVRPLDHSPFSTVGLARYDPFETTTVRVTPYMKRALTFYTDVILDRIHMHKPRAKILRKEILTYVAEDAVALNAVLCVTSGVLHCHGKQDDHKLYAMQFKGQAIHELKTCMMKSDGSTWRVSTAYAISQLLTIELMQGDTEAVHAHTHGLNLLLSRINLDECPLLMMRTIIMLHNYCAAMLQNKPTIAPIDIPASGPSATILKAINSVQSAYLERSSSHEHNQSPRNRTFCESGVSQRCCEQVLSSQFFIPPISTILGQELLDVAISQKIELCYQQLCYSQALIFNEKDIEYLCALELNNDWKLLNLLYGRENDLTSIKRATGLALYIRSRAMINITTTSSAFARSMARQLIKAVDELDLAVLRKAKATAELLLWILYVALYISDDRENVAHVTTNMVSILELLTIKRKGELEQVLSGFVYHGEFSSGNLETAWNDIEARLGVNSDS